eukprot:CAMPEP_0174258272 /NCGR_PEP_ID=MMETSP0439-20130205/7298_1 /TAXON_ID=0 /ORGANISM="Stereomyxa ramosa, Strain Chinc5" /LENGTH=287 /DNA_ID=CAMNT_0015341721 /DNA_START=57 /DNA_END=917 /DNA_ORIENTATION=-
MAHALSRVQYKTSVVVDSISKKNRRDKYPLQKEGGDELSVNGVSAGSIFSPLLDVLLDAASPASFGRHDQTLVDPSVRNAMCIPASQLKVGSLIEEEIACIPELLLPRGQDWNVKFHKLNIYQSGGFFTEHVDSYQEQGHLASLVVILPSEFTGGELVVGGKKLDLHSTEEELQFAMFYTDTPHEVLPVKSGTRVSLQFNMLIRELDEDDAEFFWQTGTPAESFEPSSANNLLQLISASKEKRLGLLLTHRYPAVGLEKDLLKGCDKQLVDLLESRGHNCFLHHVLI